MSHIRPRVALTSTLLAAGVVTGVLTGTPAQAVTGGTAATDTTYGYTARLIIGDTDRGCSGTLVDSEWLLTAASCFADSTGAAAQAGVPKLKTTATIGRSTDLAGTDGVVRQVVELVPRTDRDVVLARLNRPVTNVTPIALATTAPTAGEELKFAGYGRTKAEWAPMKLHSGAYTVDSADTTTALVTGKAGTAACAGDAGGPVVRGTGTSAALVGLNTQSYQAGCFGIDAAETRTAGVTARVDDLASWVSSRPAPSVSPTSTATASRTSRSPTRRPPSALPPRPVWCGSCTAAARAPSRSTRTSTGWPAAPRPPTGSARPSTPSTTTRTATPTWSSAPLRGPGHRHLGRIRRRHLRRRGRHRHRRDEVHPLRAGRGHRRDRGLGRGDRRPLRPRRRGRHHAGR